MHAESTSQPEPEDVKPTIQTTVAPTVQTSANSITTIDPVKKIENELKKGEYWLIGVGIASILVNRKRQRKHMVDGFESAAGVTSPLGSKKSQSAGVNRITSESPGTRPRLAGLLLPSLDIHAHHDEP